MGPRPHSPDLKRIWRKLGKRPERGRIVFDDTEPLAAMRRAITDRPCAPPLVAPPRLVRVSRTRAASARP